MQNRVRLFPAHGVLHCNEAGMKRTLADTRVTDHHHLDGFRLMRDQRSGEGK